MSGRRWFLVVVLLAGLGFFAAGMLGYTRAWAHTTDLASMQAASRTAMHQLPVAALGVALISAAVYGLWRDHYG